MAFPKISKENQPLFYAALPEDERVQTMKMFGGVCALVNGNMFSGLWADTAVVRLAAADREAALAMEESAEFDPMGRGKPMAGMVLLARAEVLDRERFRRWLAKALEHTATLPPKEKKKARAKAPVKGSLATKAVAPRTNRAPAKKAPAKKKP